MVYMNERFHQWAVASANAHSTNRTIQAMMGNTFLPRARIPLETIYPDGGASPFEIVGAVRFLIKLSQRRKLSRCHVVGIRYRATKVFRQVCCHAGRVCVAYLRRRDTLGCGQKSGTVGDRQSWQFPMKILQRSPRHVAPRCPGIAASGQFRARWNHLFLDKDLYAVRAKDKAFDSTSIQANCPPGIKKRYAQWLGCCRDRYLIDAQRNLR